MRRAVIFDFDGTLADSMKLVLSIFHELTGGKHKAKIQADIDLYRSKPAHQLVRELGIKWWQLPSLINKGRKAMHDRMTDVQPFSGLPKAVKSLNEMGYTLYIVSSNSAPNIRRFLEAHNLNQYFKDVNGGVAVFGKITALKTVMSRQRLKPKDCIYVGDEVRDVLAAKRVGIPVLAVEWGYNTGVALKTARPNLIIKSPGDLVKSIEALQAR